jgi:hypothetical protein
LDLGLGQRPRSEMTEMSFVLSNIDLADVIRQDAQMRHEDGLSKTSDILLLDAKYRSVLDEMPTFFQKAALRAGDDGHGKPALVQSWLIRLGVFQR